MLLLMRVVYWSRDSMMHCFFLSFNKTMFTRRLRQRALAITYRRSLSINTDYHGSKAAALCNARAKSSTHTRALGSVSGDKTNCFCFVLYGSSICIHAVDPVTDLEGVGQRPPNRVHDRQAIRIDMEAVRVHVEGG